MSPTFESGWQPKQQRVNPHDLLTPVRIAALPRYRAPYLPRYRSTAKRVREALKAVNTALPKYRMRHLPQNVKR